MTVDMDMYSKALVFCMHWPSGKSTCVIACSALKAHPGEERKEDRPQLIMHACQLAACQIPL